MPSFRHDGLEFHYRDQGAGRALFFQHGLGGTTEKTLASLRLPSGIRLIGLDCRAHGATHPVGPPEKLGFNQMADDLVALMQHLSIERAVLGGTSMGAGVALNCALRYPKMAFGLILLRPAWLNQPNAANVALFGLVAQLLRQHGPDQGAQMFLHTEAYRSVAVQSPDSAQSLIALFSESRALQTVARLERLPSDAPNRNKPEWHRITIPTLVMGTPDDPIHPLAYAQELADSIPGAQFRELPSKSASLPAYNQELNRSIAEFLPSIFPDFRPEPA